MADITESSSTMSWIDARLLFAASGASRKLISGPDWQSQLPGILKDLAHTVNATRCYVFEAKQCAEERVELELHTEWAAPGFDSEPPELDSVLLSVDVDGLVSGHELLDRGTVVNPDTVHSSEVRRFLERRGVRSLAVVSIVASGEWWGCLGFDDCINEREWSPEELEALSLVANALASAIERQQLEQQRARTAAIIDNSNDAIISKTLEGVITGWNRGAERIYGYTAQEAVGQKITLIIPPEKNDDFDSIMTSLREGQKVDHYETVRIRKDGRRLDVSVSISPVTDCSGEITGAVTIARDISERRQTEVAMAASEERLRLALDAGQVGAWDWHLETNDLIWSSNMEEIHGLEPGSFEGTFDGFERHIHPDDRTKVRDNLEQALTGDGEFETDYRSLKPDGCYQWISTQGRVIRDARGNAVRVTGICYDITERKQYEHLQVELLTKIQHSHAEVDAERAKLLEMFEHAPAMMALLDGPDHVFVLANDHYRKAVGYRDVLGKPVIEALPEVRDQGLVELLDHVFQHGETIVRSELPLYLDPGADGSPELRYFSFAYQPTRNSQGETTGVLVHAVDLTEHVRARQRVEELAIEAARERDRLQQVIDVMPEGVAITDQNGAFLLANSEALRIWGQPAPEGDYRQYSVFECYYPDGTPYPIEELPLSRAILRNESVLMEQLQIRNVATGELTPVLVNSAPLLDRNGHLMSAVAVFQDISGIKEFERQRDEFLQTVSHDLKNPLTTILGYAQMMRRTSNVSPERYETAIHNMETAANRAIVLLDEILDLTRLQMGRQLDLATGPVDLVQLAGRLAEQHRATTSSHEVLVEPELETLVGEWDETRLERVIDNLLANAILYSPDGGRVVVRLRRKRDTRRDVAEISIKDEGLGIPAKDMPRLFERFWRGSNVRDQIRGTGLGLSGVKANVEAHGGDIQVESVEGVGSTFTVRLPLTVSTTTVTD